MQIQRENMGVVRKTSQEQRHAVHKCYMLCGAIVIVIAVLMLSYCYFCPLSVEHKLEMMHVHSK